MITRWRFSLRFSHLPMIVSDSPPLFPDTHLEYTSAVSRASNPAATNASSKRNDVASSAVHPNTFPPNTMGAISSPEFPSFRLVIAMVLQGCSVVSLGVWMSVPICRVPSRQEFPDDSSGSASSRLASSNFERLFPCNSSAGPRPWSSQRRSRSGRRFLRTQALRFDRTRR